MYWNTLTQERIKYIVRRGENALSGKEETGHGQRHGGGGRKITEETGQMENDKSKVKYT